MPKIKYKCNYCYNYYNTEEEAISHENECIKKPELKNCINCSHKSNDNCHNPESVNYKKNIDDIEKTFDCTFWVIDD